LPEEIKMPQRVHDLSKRQIFKQAILLKKQGILYKPNSEYHQDTFKGSIDRFCEIAFRLRDSKRVLDVGAGNSLLLSLIVELGHECYALDVDDLPNLHPEIYRNSRIQFSQCHVEVDSLPFPDNFFDAVICCQVLEHFTYSPLKAMKEMYRVLKVGGLVEVDVPNAVCFRNRIRILRGKHITWDYKKHYLYAEPVIYKGLCFSPDRHNREFTKSELKLLLEESGFKNVEVYFLKSRRYREGIERIKSIGSVLKDLIPSIRKTLIAFGEKI
jgi:ubiquinone/menaquinone biosynthesis C-methylase UbiE